VASKNAGRLDQAVVFPLSFAKVCTNLSLENYLHVVSAVVPARCLIAAIMQ